MFAYGRVLSVNCVGLRPPACWCLSMWVFSRLEELAALRKRIPLYIQWTLRSLTHNGKARCAEYVCVCDVHAGRPTTDSLTPSAAADSPKYHQPHVCVCERGEGERERKRGFVAVACYRIGLRVHCVCLRWLRRTATRTREACLRATGKQIPLVTANRRSARGVA